MTQPSTTVVIVAYRSRAVLDGALSTLAPCQEAGEVHCVVVDNASDDGTATFVREHHPTVELIASSENLGFGRGCNRGAAGARTPYLLFLNPDASIDLANLRRLVDFMNERPRVGIVGPYIDNHHAGALTSFDTVVRESLLGKRAYSEWHDIVRGEKPFQTNWVCGAVFMIRRELFEALGGFDPRFFLYFEETDLCLRCAQSGYELWIEPRAEAGHLAGQSAKASGKRVGGGTISSYYYQSRYYYLRKHYGWLRANAAVTVEATILALRGLASRAGVRAPEAPTGLEERLEAGLFKMPPPPEIQTAQDRYSGLKAL